MSPQYTDSEWSEIISKTARAVQVSSSAKHAIPRPGTVGFTKTIDHTLLKLDADEAQIDALCNEARAHDFATVCVRPNFVHRCVTNLQGTDVGVACVIGFHEGTYDLAHKAAETKTALTAGARELDLVINYPLLKAGQYVKVHDELTALRTQAPSPILVKLIIETSQLTRDEIVAACVLADATDMDYVKTSTGFNGPGASEENVRLMKALCQTLAQARSDSHEMLVKASGGVRTLADAVTMLEAGASRLGTSGGIRIAQEGREYEKGEITADAPATTAPQSSAEY